MALNINSFDSKQILNENFAAKITMLLEQAISTKGFASLVVSGGSTPKPLFTELSLADLDWSKVSITLADDRWLPNDHEHSNENLVKQHLMVNKASSAKFVPLVNADQDPFKQESVISQRIDAIADKFDVLILGMGEDGHTASLFPCSEQIEAGLDRSRKLSAIATEPKTAPYLRMSMSLAKIIKAEHIFIHLTGDKKKSILLDAISNYTELEKPIKAVCEMRDVDLMWAP